LQPFSVFVPVFSIGTSDSGSLPFSPANIMDWTGSLRAHNFAPLRHAGQHLPVAHSAEFPCVVRVGVGRAGPPAPSQRR
jgi:hypothetical protein